MTSDQTTRSRELAELFRAAANAADPMRYMQPGIPYDGASLDADRTISRILYAIATVYDAHAKAEETNDAAE